LQMETESLKSELQLERHFLTFTGWILLSLFCLSFLSQIFEIWLFVCLYLCFQKFCFFVSNDEWLWCFVVSLFSLFLFVLIVLCIVFSFMDSPKLILLFSFSVVEKEEIYKKSMQLKVRNLIWMEEVQHQQVDLSQIKVNVMFLELYNHNNSKHIHNNLEVQTPIRSINLYVTLFFFLFLLHTHTHTHTITHNHTQLFS
jgi:hypothetical protein